jgi:hypothetical protein
MTSTTYHSAWFEYALGAVTWSRPRDVLHLRSIPRSLSGRGIGAWSLNQAVKAARFRKVAPSFRPIAIFTLELLRPTIAQKRRLLLIDK